VKVRVRVRVRASWSRLPALSFHPLTSATNTHQISLEKVATKSTVEFDDDDGQA